MKRLRRTVIALVTFFTMVSGVVSAQMPDWSVVIGDKAFSRDYLLDPENKMEVNDAIVQHGSENIFIKINGEWFTYEKSPVEAKLIPAVTFKDESNVKNFAEGDGEELGVKQERVSLVEGQKIKMSFAEKVLLDDVENIILVNGEKITKEQLSISEDGKCIFVDLLLNDSKENFVVKVEIDGNIQSESGAILSKKISKTFYSVINENIKEEDMVGNEVAITKRGLRVKGITFKGNLYIGASRVSLKDVEVEGNVVVDPGEKGTVSFEKVNGKEIIILSGDDHTVELKKSTFNKMLLNTDSNTRVKGALGTKIEETEVVSSGILHSLDNSFGKVTILSTIKEDSVVSFKGKFDDVFVNGKSTVKTELGTKIKNVVINSDAKFDGKFERISVEGENILVEFADRTSVKVLAAGASTRIKAGRKVAFEKVEGPEALKEEIKKVAHIGKKIMGPISGGSSTPQTKFITNEYEFDKAIMKFAYRDATDSLGTPVTISFDLKDKVEKAKVFNITLVIKDKSGNIANLGQVNPESGKFIFQGKLKPGSYTVIFNIVELGEKYEQECNINI